MLKFRENSYSNFSEGGKMRIKCGHYWHEEYNQFSLIGISFYSGGCGRLLGHTMILDLFNFFVEIEFQKGPIEYKHNCNCSV